MKSIIKICVVGILLSGVCEMLNIPKVFGMSQRPLYYSVKVMNVGVGKINVYPFNLDNTGKATVDVGHVQPSGRAVVSPFFCIPKRQIVIKWEFLETGEIANVEAKVDLPKEFTKKNGRGINFHIDTKKKNVLVTYDIFDKVSGQIKEVSPVPRQK